MTRRAFSLPTRDPVYQIVRWCIILALGYFLFTIGLAIVLGDIQVTSLAEAEANKKRALEQDVVNRKIYGLTNDSR